MTTFEAWFEVRYLVWMLDYTSRKELKACGTFNFSLAVSVIKRQ
jgi:hypothetical protein